MHTDIDDCTRYMVIGVYLKRTAANTLHLIVEAMYDPSKEHLRARNYRSDRKLKN